MKVTVLISGRGSNLQALIDACAKADFPAEIVRVISNEADAGGLDKAAEAGLPTAVVPHRDHPDRPAFEAELDKEIRAAGTELIALAGFMRLLTEGFVDAWRDQLINIHPSLLPAFKGLHTHERAIDAGVRFSGCTVHYVRPAMDEGPIIEQDVTRVSHRHGPSDLIEKGRDLEKLVLSRAVRRHLQNCVLDYGNKTVVFD